MGIEVDAKKFGANKVVAKIGKMTKKEATSNGVYAVRSAEGNRRGGHKLGRANLEAYQRNLRTLKKAHHAQAQGRGSQTTLDVTTPPKHV